MIKIKYAKLLLLPALLTALALALFGCGAKAPQTAAASKQTLAATVQTAQTTPATTVTTSSQTSTPSSASKAPTPAPASTTPVQKSAPAPAPKPTPAPAAVSMSAAASAGSTLYSSLCARCHGANAVGPQPGVPNLKGSSMSAFASQATLATVIRSSMPADHPGSLSSTQAGDLSAYLFYLNGK